MESENRICVVFKKHGIVYYEWFTNVESAYKFSAALTQENSDYGIVISDKTNQEFTFGKALQENRRPRVKQGYLISYTLEV